MLGAYGVVTGEGVVALTVSRPRALLSEQDPESWWAAANAAVAAIDPKLRRAVRRIGLAG